MKEMVKDNRALDHGIDECCSIAESMIDEIHHIAIQEKAAIPASGGHKGSLKEKLLRQIRQARKMAMTG
jgi:hypothetical protein